MTAILVTGGTGALGRQLVPRLCAAGHDVRVLSRRDRAAADWAAGTSWAVGDLLTGAGLGEALRAAGRRRPVLPVRLPGRVMRGYAAGGHLAPDCADGRVSFAGFLREHVSPAARSRPYGRLR